MNFLALCKLFLLSSTVELGVIPGHDLSLFQVPDYQVNLNVAQTYYSDLQATLDIAKYGFVTSGVTAYSLLRRTDANFYPFRVDFQLGAGLRYKAFEAGWIHGCYHPIAPDEYAVPLPKIDAAQDRFYVKCQIGKRAWQ